VIDAPRFSVIIPAHNSQDTLAETIESVLCQRFDQWEIVVVQENSTDSTSEILDEYALREPRIRLAGLEVWDSVRAKNTAVRETAGEMIVELSDGDLLMPTHLLELDEFISANPDASMFSCDCLVETGDGNVETPEPKRRLSVRHDRAREESSVEQLCCAGAVFRREVFDAVGGFREGAHDADRLFWSLAFSIGYRHRHLARPLSVHKLSPAPAVIADGDDGTFRGRRVTARHSDDPGLPIAASWALATRRRCNLLAHRIVRALLGRR